MRYAYAAGLTALIAAATPALTKETTVHHAKGKFEVTVTPEAQVAAPGSDGVATGRMGLRKVFAGPLAGVATGTMLTAGSPGQAMTYVAIDQFTGTLDGRVGGFVLAHRGTMSPATAPALTIEITPDSGTGALAGIRGTLAIEVTGGVHHYDLAYTLPTKDR